MLTKISNLFLIIPGCIALILILWSFYYWYPRSYENPGMCVKRFIGHGTFIVETGMDGPYLQDTLIPIRSADYRTFQNLKKGYCKDNKHIYNAAGIVDNLDNKNL